jgi:hypothetical protein
MPLLVALERIADALVESRHEQILDGILRHDAQNERKRNAKQARDMVVEGLVAGTLPRMWLGIKVRLQKFLDLEPPATPDAVRERVFEVYFKADPIVAEALVVIARTIVDQTADLRMLNSLCEEYAMRKQRVALLCEKCNAQKTAGANWTLTPTDAAPVFVSSQGQSTPMWDVIREVRAKDAKGRDHALKNFLLSNRHGVHYIDPDVVTALLGDDMRYLRAVINNMVTVRTTSSGASEDTKRPPDAFIGLCADEYVRQRFGREEGVLSRVMLAALTWLLAASVTDEYGGDYHGCMQVTYNSYEKVFDLRELRAALEDASIAAKQALTSI